MKLGVMIDSEHYTDVYREVFQDRDDEVGAMVGLMNDSDYELKEHTPEGRYTFEMDEENWAVGQVFQLNELPYALVYHHAYDGVDFELKGQFNSYNDAVNMRSYLVKEMVESNEDPFNKMPDYDESDLYNLDEYVVWDDGQEWNVWTIIKVNNTETERKIDYEKD